MLSGSRNTRTLAPAIEFAVAIGESDSEFVKSVGQAVQVPTVGDPERKMVQPHTRLVERILTTAAMLGQSDPRQE